MLFLCFSYAASACVARAACGAAWIARDDHRGRMQRISVRLSAGDARQRRRPVSRAEHRERTREERGRRERRREGEEERTERRVMEKGRHGRAMERRGGRRDKVSGNG